MSPAEVTTNVEGLVATLTEGLKENDQFNISGFGVIEVKMRKERLSVTEISNRCGFSSISYFSRVFRQDTGMTPLQYKKSAGV